MKLLKILIAVGITAVVVYYGLTLLSPHRSAPRLESPPPTPGPRPTASTAAAAAVASVGVPALANRPQAVAAPVATPVSVKPAAPTSSALSAAQARQIAEQVGTQAAEKVVRAMTPTAPASTGISAEQVRQIARQVAEQVVDERLEQLRAALAANKAPPSPRPKTRRRRPATRVAAGRTPAPSVAKAKPAPAVQTASKLPAADVLQTWWTPIDRLQPGQFALIYAGEAAFEPALVLLFSNPLQAADQAGAQIQVYDASGKPAEGTWTLGKNPRMLILKGLAKGRYTVVVGDGVRDSQGVALRVRYSGPVYVN